MNFFQKAKAMLANVVRNVILKTGDRSRVIAGKALTGHQDRMMTPPEWIRWYLNGNKVPLARAPKRSPNDGRGDTYGAMQRKRALARKRRNPLLKAWRAAHRAKPPIVRIERRDALTGIVS